MPRTTRERSALGGILAAFVVLAATYSITIPIFESSDELWHYPMVEVIARTWTLPVQPTEPGTTSGPWRQEGSQQPLYYGMAALLTAWIDTTDMDRVRQPNPHARAGEITPDRDNVNLVIHDPAAEGFPWSGTALAVHLVRFLSVAMGACSVYLTWALVCELYPQRPWVSVASAAVHAFTPMYLFISSSVNNDNLIIPLCTWALLLMVRRVRAGGRLDFAQEARSSLGLGVVVGLAALTKTSALGLLPFVAATLAWEAWRRPSGTAWSHCLLRLTLSAALILLPAIAISGWWYARNLRLYGDLLGWSAFGAVLGTRDVPADLAQLWAERRAFFAGYWGSFGGLNLPMPTWVYRSLNALALFGGVGLVIELVRWLSRDDEAGTRRVPAVERRRAWVSRVWPFAWTSATAARALAWAWPVAIVVSWVRWATITWSSQGRLVFPAISLWSLALVIGLGAWMPRASRLAGRVAPQAVPGITLGVLLLLVTSVALPAWILPAYKPPLAQATWRSAEGSETVAAEFGNALELVGYRVTSQAVSPNQTLELDLVWRALGPTRDFHSIYIHALGTEDRIVAQRDTFPGHGLLPTTRLEAGRTWQEHHALRVPHTAYTPDALSIAVGVYETGSGTRLRVVGNDADAVEFGNVPLVSATGAQNQVSIQFGDGILLESYDLSALSVSRGEQVAVTLSWVCRQPIAHDYTVSVQLIDDAWRKAAQADTWPLDGRRPTTGWRRGEALEEVRRLTISPDAEPGAYGLRIALYRPAASGELVHLPVSVTKEGMPSKAIELTKIRVRE